MSVDIVFYTHANNDTGFGHAARCAKIAKIVNEIAPNLNIGFCGEFSTGAKEVINTLCNPVFLAKPNAVVGIYDRMDQVSNPEKWSHERLAFLRHRCKKVVFMANGREVPKISLDVTIIGYKIGPKINARPNCHWGLEYTPVDNPLVTKDEHTAAEHRVLLALGGGQGNALTKRALLAVDNIQEISGTKILLSPVNPISFDIDFEEIKKPFSQISNVPDLSPIIVSSKVVLASYGHLAYEAMALKVPVCLVAQKKFQAEYASVLAQNKFCVFAGGSKTVTVSSIENGIRNALKFSDELVENASKSISSGGLRRIAKIIIAKVLDER